MEGGGGGKSGGWVGGKEAQRGEGKEAPEEITDDVSDMSLSRLRTHLWKYRRANLS